MVFHHPVLKNRHSFAERTETLRERERERERERGVESVDTPLFTSLAQNELQLAAITASAIVVLGAATDF